MTSNKKYTKVKVEDFTRVNSDMYGNPRYAIHFLSLLTNRELDNPNNLFLTALHKASFIGGSKYRGKEYGGMIVFQSYNLQDECDAINEMLKLSDKTITYHRNPTKAEIRFGEGAAHHRDFYYYECTRDGENFKKWLTDENDVRWYY